jgi:hypothetical protein
VVKRIIAVLAGLAGLVAATAWMLGRGTRGAELANIWALPVSAAGLLVAASGWSWRARRGPGRTVEEAARLIAARVAEREATVLHRLTADTGDARAADVGFRVVPPPEGRRDDGGPAAGTLHAAAAFYRDLRRGRLVLLGEAGSGKTVTALQMALDLLPSGPPGPANPVPVRLSASRFPAVRSGAVLPELLRERLDEWLSRHLAAEFGVEPAVAGELVRGGWILPVLDGLDEMDPPPEPGEEQSSGRARLLLRALNQPTATGPRRVILTCRSQTYADLEKDGGESLQDATSVEQAPLTVEQAAAWIAHRFPGDGPDRVARRWRPVVAAIRADPGGPIAVGLASPLRLYLAVTAFTAPGTDPAELLGVGPDDLDEHLFSRLIPALARDHPHHTGHYRPADVHRWLTTLAGHLANCERNGRSGTDLHRSDLWRAGRAPKVTRLLTAALVTLPLVAVTATWFAAQAVARQTSVLRAGLLTAIAVAGLAAAIVALLAIGEETRMPWTGRHPELLLGAAGVAVGGLLGANFANPLAGALLGCAAAPALGVVGRGHAAWPRYALAITELGLTGALPLRLGDFLGWASAAGLLRGSGDAVQFRHLAFQTWLRRGTPGPEPAPAHRPVAGPATEVAGPADPRRRAGLRTIHRLSHAVWVPFLLPFVLTALIIGAWWSAVIVPVLALGWMVVLTCGRLELATTFLKRAGGPFRPVSLLNGGEESLLRALTGHGVDLADVIPVFASPRFSSVVTAQVTAGVTPPRPRVPRSWPVVLGAVGAGLLLSTTLGGPDGIGRVAAVLLTVVLILGLVRVSLLAWSAYRRPYHLLMLPRAILRLPASQLGVVIAHEAVHLRHRHPGLVQILGSVRVVALGATLAYTAGGLLPALLQDRLSAAAGFLVSGIGSLCAVSAAFRLRMNLLQLITDAEAFRDDEARNEAAVMLSAGASASLSHRLRWIIRAELPRDRSLTVAVIGTVTAVAGFVLAF